MQVIHYSGEIIHAMGHVLPGWAACCSGEKALKIARDHNTTGIREHVTCKSCLKMIAKHDKWAEEHPTNLKSRLAPRKASDVQIAEGATRRMLGQSCGTCRGSYGETEDDCDGTCQAEWSKNCGAEIGRGPCDDWRKG